MPVSVMNGRQTVVTHSEKVANVDDVIQTVDKSRLKQLKQQMDEFSQSLNVRQRIKSNISSKSEIANDTSKGPFCRVKRALFVI